MALNFSAELDPRKFGAMAKEREEAIQKAPVKEIQGEFSINKAAAALHPAVQRLVIKEVIDHGGAGAKTFVFGRADGGNPAYFRAGQYLSVAMEIGGSRVTRPFSISSSPKWALEGKCSITVKKAADAFASDWILDNWKVGTAVSVSGPEGCLYYEPLRDAKNVVAIAGGSGITPFLSMAYAVRDGIEDFDLTILFGSRTVDAILFRKELEEIAAACPRVKVVHVLSEEERPGYEHGFITAELIKKYAAGTYSVFLCGPGAMYGFLEGELAKLELPRKFIRRELMGAPKKPWELPGYPAEARDKSFKLSVSQCGRMYEIEALAGEPVLVACERAGLSVPSRCRSGECGWCRSKLLSGDVFLPEDYEGRRAADLIYGYIHPCCSFPLSDLSIEVPGSYN